MILNLIESVSEGFPSYSLNDGPNIKLVDLFKLVGIGLSLLLLGHSRFNLWFSFPPVFQWYCFTSLRSPSVTMHFCRVLIS